MQNKSEERPWYDTYIDTLRETQATTIGDVYAMKYGVAQAITLDNEH